MAIPLFLCSSLGSLKPYGHLLHLKMSYDTDNKESLKFSKEIEKYWKGLGELYLISFINMHTLFIETGKQKNSNLILLGRGGSKSDFLTTMYNNNLKHINLLPDKMFESFLANENKDYFNNKIHIHTDLITGFAGLSGKQRQQLIGFWNSLLADRRYLRHNNQEIKIDGCVCMFGFALDNYDKYKTDLLESTFLDRLTIVIKRITYKEKREILKFMQKKHLKSAKKHQKNPVFRLKSAKKQQKIAIFLPNFEEKINNFAIDFDLFNVMSFTRAKQYIINFLMANAFYNHRKEVKNSDMEIYEKIHNFHKDKQDISNYNKIAHLLNNNENVDDKILIKKSGFSRGTFYKYKKIFIEKTAI